MSKSILLENTDIHICGNTNTQKSDRFVNFEFLRITSIFMVIILHFINNSQFNDVVDMYSINGYIYSFIQGLCYTVDNLFILLSGYFLVNSKFKPYKVFDLWFQVFFYSFGFFLILTISGVTEFSLKNLYYAITPIFSKAYWFFSCYIILYLVSPLINTIIKNSNRKKHFILIVAGFVLFSLLDSVLFSQDPFFICGGKSPIWFIYLYITAAYIRLYVTRIPRKIYLGSGALVLSVITAAGYYGYSYLIEKSGATFIDPQNLRSLCSVPVFLSSICIFLLFKGINIKGKLTSRALVFLSPLTFGIYLIHDNKNLKDLLWYIISPEKYSDEVFVWLYMLAVVPIIYIVCAVVELLRQKLFSITRLNNLGILLQKKFIILSNKNQLK